MKKMFCLVISLLVLLGSVSAMAEGFSIHSGVEFGMTMDEVIQKEKDAGFSVETIELDDYDGWNCPDNHSPSAVSVDGQIAGINGANITYHFQNNGKMDAAIYLLGATSGVYAPIRDSLIRKYGEPDTDMSDVWHSYLDLDVYSKADYNSQRNIHVCKIDYLNDDSWLLPQEDGSYIIITGLEFSQKIASLGTYIWTYVGYQLFSEEEINNALANAKETIDTYNNQLENDL